MILFIVAPVVIYLIAISFKIDIFAGELSTKTSMIIISLVLYTTLFNYFLYRKLSNVDKYEEILEEQKKLNWIILSLKSVAISKSEKDNFKYAKYLLRIARKKILSLSVLSSPKANKNTITQKEDIANEIIEKMKDGNKQIAQDFKFKRIISLQNNEEILFADYLEEKKNENTTYSKGSFDFKIYNVSLLNNDNSEEGIQFPNFLVIDDEIVFITFRQYEKQSRGLLIISHEIAEILSSYFTYLWKEKCQDYQKIKDE
ncbi:hypothetical protein KAU32_10410 [bacterium]|nr:hypothetical protein [bacterium]